MFVLQLRAHIVGFTTAAVAALAVATAIPCAHAAPEATFTVIANTTPANGGQNFNGVAKGRLTITVPPGAAVLVKFMNAKSAPLPHSFQVIPLKGTPEAPVLPAQAEAQPAFPGAATPNAGIPGTPPGQSADVRFTATKAGQYLFICGYPGHALLGMYGTFDVTPGAKPAMVVK
jgi:sulfocyanin